MAQRWKAFWLTEVPNRVQVSLRRLGGPRVCDGSTRYCQARVTISDDADALVVKSVPVSAYRGHASWPTMCFRCGQPFHADGQWLVDTEQLYEGAPDEKRYTLRDAPIGAMWDAHWYRNAANDLNNPYTGPDGLSLVVKTPGGDWLVDGEASNCKKTQYGPTLADPKGVWWLGRTHYCWIRHGDPHTGNVHVDKNGETCKAGAGSIQIGGWHGYLDHGYLTTQRAR